MKSLFLLLSSLVFSSIAHGAACCGGGFASPSIIAGEDRAQITAAMSFTQVVVDSVDSQGIWRKTDSHQNVKTTKLDAAHIFADRYQFGISILFIERSKYGDTYSGLGDIGFTLGYEYLPDWDYNPIRPKGIGYIQLLTPTGKSKLESETGGLDSRGNGLWSVGTGTLLTKTWAPLDAFMSLDIHRSFSKSISNSQIEGKLNPNWGGQFAAGLGYSVKDYRIGSSLTWSHEDPIILKTKTTTSSSGNENYTSFAATLSYLANDEWAGTISYTDQTLFGDPLNTSLGRGISIQVQHRLLR